MKTSNKILLSFLFLIFLAGITTISYMRANTVTIKTVQPIGEDTTINYNLENLKYFEASIGRIKLLNGDPKVQIKCADNIQKLINAGFKDGKFYIRKNDTLKNNIEFDVRVYSNDLEKIKLYDWATMRTGSNEFKTQNLSIELYNTSRNLDEFTLDVNTLNLKSSNASKILLKGKANHFNVFAQNAAKVFAESLETNIADVSISNAAYVIANVNGKLSLNISNAGKFTLRGNPEILTQNISSGGTLEYIGQ